MKGERLWSFIEDIRSSNEFGGRGIGLGESEDLIRTASPLPLWFRSQVGKEHTEREISESRASRERCHSNGLKSGQRIKVMRLGKKTASIEVIF